ncbi:MAG: type II toxin-antitoxin system HipA family toxin YjjJ, partial [bacterium]
DDEAVRELALRAAGALGVSQPTVSRSISALSAQRVLRVGRGKAARYALRRSISGLGSTWPLYTIAADGGAGLVGRIHALEAGQWYVEQDEPWDTLRGTEFRDGLYPGLPWFVHELRPQGFLGRCFARRYAQQLGAPLDPSRWNDEAVVTALVRFGEDLPGAFAIGDAMLAAIQMRRMETPGTFGHAIRCTDYPAQADAILAGEWPGSSAAGEQPKFTACIHDSAQAVRHVIVKFSGGAGRPENRRWADLLVAEHMANTVLSAHGIPCAATTVIEAGGRVFLESTRFDRVGAHGRRGLTSLEALDAAFFGRIDTPWTDAAERLRADGWIPDEDAERLSVLWWFGTLIGNTDMHYGNASLFLEPRLPLSLAPLYDMVPMHYRPGVEGQFSNEPLRPPPPPPEALTPWTRAAVLAEQFWSRLSETVLASASFRHIAEQNAGVVSSYLRSL